MNYHVILPSLQNMISDTPYQENTLRLVHTLKGLMGTFAFLEAEQAAITLEKSMKKNAENEVIQAYQMLEQTWASSGLFDGTLCIITSVSTYSLIDDSLNRHEQTKSYIPAQESSHSYP